jgi:SAM-dependent methyltransferase
MMTLYQDVADKVISCYTASGKPMMGFGTAAEEAEYVRVLRDSFVQTISDIDALWPVGERCKKSLLEIGSFLGVVSFSLKKLGYSVSALDIPEFHQAEQCRLTYERNGVGHFGVNLRHGKLPFEDSSFDAVIACEIFEHFNFNPLPVLAEINRVLRPGGYLYIAMPNQAHLGSRIKAVLGKSVRNSISTYFKQLDRNENKMVAIHWREYTLAETVEMVTSMGFEVVKTYYFSERGTQKFASSKAMRELYSLCKRAALSWPSLKRHQVVIAKRTHTPKHEFWFTEANS